jgi:hypothetical protein
MSLLIAAHPAGNRTGGLRKDVRHRHGHADPELAVDPRYTPKICVLEWDGKRCNLDADETIFESLQGRLTVL